MIKNIINIIIVIILYVQALQYSVMMYHTDMLMLDFLSIAIVIFINMKGDDW